MSDEIETIDKNPKSWAAWKREAERLQAIIDDVALAAVDSKQVILYRQVNPVNGMKTYWAELDPEEFRHLKQHTDENAEFMTLYRHAQPVVPDGLVKAVEFYEQVKRENPPVETGAWKDAVDWVLKEACRAAMLAAATQEPAHERDNVRSEHAESVRDTFRFVREQHAEWSDRQFGNVGPVWPLKHLAKEAIEAAEAPDDISEFADIIMLVWDTTRRAGFSDEQLAEAVAEKLERNKRRAWGEVKDGEPCHHVKN